MGENKMIDLTQKTISRLLSECLTNLPLNNTFSKQPETQSFWHLLIKTFKN